MTLYTNMSFTKSKVSITIPRHILLGLASLLILVIPIHGEESCSVEGFKEGVDNFVDVRYSKKPRGGKQQKDVTQAEIVWSPLEMLKNPNCFDKQVAELEMKHDGENQYAIPEVKSQNHGQKMKWTVTVKPCLNYHFRIKVTGNDINSNEAHYPIPRVLARATEEEIKASGYTPEAPTGFKAVVDSGSATISWTPSDCATSYEVSYLELGEDNPKTVTPDGTTAEISGLKYCTRYEVTISSVLEGEYGDLITQFSTKPRTDAAKQLDVTINPGLDSVQLSWGTWKDVSCIDSYEVRACKVDKPDECTNTETVNKSSASPLVKYKLEGLDPCTDYVLDIKPLFNDTVLETKQETFRTDSMDASDISIKTVGGEMKSSNSALVSWDSAQCASKYRVWQKEVGAKDDWVRVAETDSAEDTQIPVSNIKPCTTYQFAISAVVIDAKGQEVDTVKTQGPELMSKIDANIPFKPPGHHIAENGDDNLVIEWGHADCIESYELETCPENGVYTECQPKITIPPNDDGDRMIRHRIENLESCTKYNLKITPVIQGKGQFQAEAIQAQTTNGTPMSPQDFTVEINSDGAAVVSDWSTANCATGYRIYYKEGEEANEEHVDVPNESDSKKIFEKNKPCFTYSYAITTLVEEKESEEKRWQNLDMPPNKSVKPILKFIGKDDLNNVTLNIESASGNEKCVIDKYEIDYKNKETSCEFTPLGKGMQLDENGDIKVTLEGADSSSTVFQARVHYENDSADKWSVRFSTGAVACEILDGVPSNFPMIPVIVGVALLALVVIIVTVLLIKRRKNRNFDPEKAENGHAKNHHNNLANSDEETQKLNDAV